MEKTNNIQMTLIVGILMFTSLLVKGSDDYLIKRISQTLPDGAEIIVEGAILSKISSDGKTVLFSTALEAGGPFVPGRILLLNKTIILSNTSRVMALNSEGNLLWDKRFLLEIKTLTSSINENIVLAGFMKRRKKVETKLQFLEISKIDGSIKFTETKKVGYVLPSEGKVVELKKVAKGYFGIIEIKEEGFPDSENLTISLDERLRIITIRKHHLLSFTGGKDLEMRRLEKDSEGLLYFVGYYGEEDKTTLGRDIICGKIDFEHEIQGYKIITSNSLESNENYAEFYFSENYRVEEIFNKTFLTQE